MTENISDALGEWTLTFPGKYNGKRITIDLSDGEDYVSISANAVDRGVPYMMQETRNLLYKIMERNFPDEDVTELKKYVIFNFTAMFEKSQMKIGGIKEEDINSAKNASLQTQGVTIRKPVMAKVQGTAIKNN